MRLKIINNIDFPGVKFTDGAEFRQCTTNSIRIIEGAFYPESVAEIKALVKWARSNQQTLWPVSTGKNWGYGSALPVTDNCHIVSLSRLTGIRDFNPKTGVITVEPGVTQQALYDYLKDTFYINPVTGAGPETSVLGNTLERGYGLAPTQDHFSSLISLRAILGNGEGYCSPLRRIAGSGLDHTYKWGIGPYLDGLFGQSNFGIVTEITIQLAKKPKHQRLVKLAISDSSFYDAIAEIQQLLQDYDGLLSGINLMNKARVLAMNVSKAPAWTGIFAISACDKNMVNAAYRAIKKRLKKHCSIISVNPERLDQLSRLPLPKTLKDNVDHAKAVKAIFNGEPTVKALNLTYLHNPSTTKRTYNPDEDGCGLIWYSPLVEMNKLAIENYLTHVNTVCAEYEIEPLITLTSLNARCFDSTVPVLFNKQSEDHAHRASGCFDALLEKGRKKGIYPYRLPIHAMDKLVRTNPVFFNQVNQIKKVLDPDQVIAPGRYCATPW